MSLVIHPPAVTVTDSGHVYSENVARTAVLVAAKDAARIQSETNDSEDLTGLTGTIANQQEPATQAGILVP